MLKSKWKNCQFGTEGVLSRKFKYAASTCLRYVTYYSSIAYLLSGYISQWYFSVLIHIKLNQHAIETVENIQHKLVEKKWLKIITGFLLETRFKNKYRSTSSPHKSEVMHPPDQIHQIFLCQKNLD